MIILESSKSYFGAYNYCLFNVFLENILAEAFEDCKKLGINVDGCELKDLRFADDIALIADSRYYAKGAKFCNKIFLRVYPF